VVEQVWAEEPAAGRDLGHGGVGRRRLERAGAAAVDELEGRNLPHGRDRERSALGELRRRTPLHPADDGPTGGSGIIAEARDLPLVRHHPDEFEPGAASDHLGERPGVLHRMDGRAPRAHMAEEPGTPRGIQLEADPDACPHVRRHHRIDRIELGYRVDHDGHAGGSIRIAGEFADGGGIDRGVSDHDVVDRPVTVGRPREPERLGQRVGEDPAEPRQVEHGVEHGTHPQRLARHPDARAASALDEGAGIRRDGGQRECREWWVEVVRRRLQVAPICGARAPRRGHVG
jgi:hypothetical protein